MAHNLRPLRLKNQKKLFTLLMKASPYVMKQEALKYVGSERDLMVRHLEKLFVKEGKNILLSYYPHEDERWYSNSPRVRRNIPVYITNIGYGNRPYGCPYIEVRFINFYETKWESVKFDLTDRLTKEEDFPMGLWEVQWRPLTRKELEILESINDNCYVRKKILPYDPRHTYQEHIWLAGNLGIRLVGFDEKAWKGLKFVYDNYSPRDKIVLEPHGKIIALEDGSPHFVMSDAIFYNPDYYEICRFPDYVEENTEEVQDS